MPFGADQRIVIDSGVAFFGISKPMQPVTGFLVGEQQLVGREPAGAVAVGDDADPVTLPSDVCSVVPLVVRVGSMMPLVWPVTKTPTSLLPGCARSTCASTGRRPCRP